MTQNGYPAGDEGKQALINEVQERLGLEGFVSYWDTISESGNSGESTTGTTMTYTQGAHGGDIENNSTSSVTPVAGGLYYNAETGEYVDHYNYEGER